MIGIIINLSNNELKIFKEYCEALKRENFAFIVLSDTDFDKLEFSDDKKTLLNSPDFLKKIKYKLCGSYSPKDNVLTIEDCDEKYSDLLFETIHKYFEDELTIIVPYKNAFLKQGFNEIIECNSEGNGLCMRRRNQFLNKSDKQSATLQISYLKKMYEKEYCTISLKLEDDSIQYLQYVTKAGVTANKKGDGMSQKEVFGKFKIIKSEIHKGNITHTLQLDKSSIVYGEEDEITTTGSLYNFHSHPHNAYVMYGAKYGVPSLADYIAVYTLCKVQNTIVHFVASLEGLYVISINPKSKVCKLPVKEGLKFVKKNFRYNEGHNIEDLDHYMKYINSKGVFKLSLIPWNKLGEKLISIEFNKVGKICVINEN